MNIIRAEAMGFCFGVRDALEAANRTPSPELTTIHGELVHNEVILEQMLERGFRIQPETARDVLDDRPQRMITAHGISDSERQRLESAGKTVIDTTCPLVRRAHDAARDLARDGFFVVVVGKPGHVEVEGLTGDLEHFAVVADSESIPDIDSRRIGVISQTTATDQRVESVVSALQDRYPRAEFRIVDTVCAPTRDRQRALERLIAHCELIIVVGSEGSNNSAQLVRTARDRGRKSFLVSHPDQIDLERLRSVKTVGLTAGTSTPDAMIEAVYNKLTSFVGV